MMSWKLTFIVLTIVPIYAVVTLQYTRRAKELVRKNQDIQAEITVHIGEKFAGIQTIKSYCA
jgi:ABC-type multidrug transport system fused ATPase/permease subunit